MGLLALAVAPGIAISIFIYLKDKYNKEPFGLLVWAFVLGMISTIPAALVQMVFTAPVQLLLGKGVVYTAVFAFLVVALSEEGSKFLLMRIFIFNRKAFDDPFDGIIYCVMVGMGFGKFVSEGAV